MCAGFQPTSESVLYLNSHTMHLLDGLPESWIVERDENSRATAVKHSITAGFVRGGRFYTRSQATRKVLAEFQRNSILEADPAYG